MGSFVKVEQTVKIIGELVEQGECFFRNDKYKEAIAEIRNLESFITEKYLEDAEETTTELSAKEIADITAIVIERQLELQIAASHNNAAKKIYNNTIRFLQKKKI